MHHLDELRVICSGDDESHRQSRKSFIRAGWLRYYRAQHGNSFAAHRGITFLMRTAFIE
jgi:hypothetical protein